MPEVEALYTVSGKIDLIAIMRVDSPALLDHALDRLGSLEGVEDTDSSIILATKFDRR
jgi:DNA-binding Lrp family transcriptional regulator